MAGDKARFWVATGMIAILLLVAIPSAYLLFGMPGLEVISILASSGLTLGLLILYREQHYALRYQQEPRLELSGLQIHGNLEDIKIELSNYGGGPATSMHLCIELFELDGSGPIRSADGNLRRIRIEDDGSEQETRSSSIRPSELNIPFVAQSRSVIPMGGESPRQDSLAKILSKEFVDDRSVIYGKIAVEYKTKFSDDNRHVADFSLKFTQKDGLEYEPMDFLPWEEENEHSHFGG